MLRNDAPLMLIRTLPTLGRSVLGCSSLLPVLCMQALNDVDAGAMDFMSTWTSLMRESILQFLT